MALARLRVRAPELYSRRRSPTGRWPMPASPPPDRGPEHRTRLSSRPGTLLGGIHRRAKSQPGARSRSATSLCGHFLRPNTVHSSPIGPPCAPQVVEILPLGIKFLVPSALPGPQPVPQPGGGAHTFEWAGVGWRKQGLLMSLNQVLPVATVARCSCLCPVQGHAARLWMTVAWAMASKVPVLWVVFLAWPPYNESGPPSAEAAIPADSTQHAGACQ